MNIIISNIQIYVVMYWFMGFCGLSYIKMKLYGVITQLITKVFH